MAIINCTCNANDETQSQIKYILEQINRANAATRTNAITKVQSLLSVVWEYVMNTDRGLDNERHIGHHRLMLRVWMRSAGCSAPAVGESLPCAFVSGHVLFALLGRLGDAPFQAADAGVIHLECPMEITRFRYLHKSSDSLIGRELSTRSRI